MRRRAEEAWWRGSGPLTSRSNWTVYHLLPSQRQAACAEKGAGVN